MRARLTTATFWSLLVLALVLSPLLGLLTPYISLVFIVPLFFVLVASDPPTMLLSIFASYALSAPTLWLARRIRRALRGPTPRGT